MIGTRRRFQPCQPLVNFAHNLQGPQILEIAAEEQPHQWVVFVDVETIVVWRDGLVNRVAAPQIAKKCRCDHQTSSVYNVKVNNTNLDLSPICTTRWGSASQTLPKLKDVSRRHAIFSSQIGSLLDNIISNTCSVSRGRAGVCTATRPLPLFSPTRTNGAFTSSGMTSMSVRVTARWTRRSSRSEQMNRAAWPSCSGILACAWRTRVSLRASNSQEHKSRAHSILSYYTHCDIYNNMT